MATRARRHKRRRFAPQVHLAGVVDAHAFQLVGHVQAHAEAEDLRADGRRTLADGVQLLDDPDLAAGRRVVERILHRFCREGVVDVGQSRLSLSGNRTLRAPARYMKADVQWSHNAERQTASRRSASGTKGERFRKTFNAAEFEFTAVLVPSRKDSSTLHCAEV